jgi:hypothetical protein
VNPYRKNLPICVVLWGVLAVMGCDLKRQEVSNPNPKPQPPVEKAAESPKPVVPAPPKEVAKAPEPKPVEVPKPAPKQAATPPELLQIKAEISQAKAQTDITIGKLQVLAASTGDIDKPSEEAVAAIQALGAATAVLKKRADDMRERGAAYFEAWEKQLAATSTPAVAALISKRKDELSRNYADTLTSMQQTRAAYDPFWANLEASAKSIEDGMNPDQLKLFAPTLAKLKGEANTFKDRISVVSTKLDQIAGLYSNP